MIVIKCTIPVAGGVGLSTEVKSNAGEKPHHEDDPNPFEAMYIKGAWLLISP